MTEPDEALIWARGQSGEDYPATTGLLAFAYRAGQAASVERIKALEHDLMWTDRAWEAAQEAVVYGYTLMDEQDERIKALEEVTQNLIAMFDCDDPEVSARAWDEALDEARALLKEADQ